MVLQESFELNNDVNVPQLGLDTWFIDDGNASVFPVFGDKIR